MGKYIAKRILMLLPVLIGVSLISFSLLHMVPGDPAELLAGEDNRIHPAMRRNTGWTAALHSHHIPCYRLHLHLY
jgi:ABC-type dipeptide/oligopeptide/nickel transport system permease component